MLLHIRKLSILLLLVACLFISAHATAQAPNPLPARDHDVAILVVDDFGDPFSILLDEYSASATGTDCLLLHSLEPDAEVATLPQASRSLGMASRSLGMASRSLGMTNDESNVTVPHGQFVFTQFADFSDPSAYDGLDLEKWVLHTYLDGSNNFTRYTYPATHTIKPGEIATNPNQVEFSGYDLIPVHADAENADNLDIDLIDAVSRTLALGYSDVVVNMSFGFFDCDNLNTYQGGTNGNAENTVDETDDSDFHTAITSLKNTYPNVIFVGASGNYQLKRPFAPARWDEVISVDAFYAVDTVEELTNPLANSHELFMARRDVPLDSYTNTGSVLMPGSWGNISQLNYDIVNETIVPDYDGDGVHLVHFEGTSFAAPWLSLYLAQYLDTIPDENACLIGLANDTLTNALTINWTLNDTPQNNIATIVRDSICPELHATGFDTGSKQLTFSTYIGSPNLAINITQPSASVTVGESFRFEGSAFDQNAGIGNGSSIEEVEIYQSANCTDNFLLKYEANQAGFPQTGFDISYNKSGFGGDLFRPDGLITLTACAKSLFSPQQTLSATVTFTVDSTVSPCTIIFPTTVNTAQELIDAILCANVTATTDTINLGTNITLTATDNTVNGNNGLPNIFTPIIINGNGHIIRRSIASTDDFRIFHVDDTGTLTLNDITLSNGVADYNGGAIFNNGTLTINNGTLSNNSAFQGGGAIWNNGMLTTSVTISNSTISGNSAGSFGGGIRNSGTMTISNSTITDNSAYGGGGIENWGNAIITDSTISGNSANTSGGGIFNSETLTVLNSVIQNNSATEHGGGIYTVDDATIINSTIIGNNTIANGGGIFNSNKLTLVNSIVSGNDSNIGGGIFNDSVGTDVRIYNSTIASNSAYIGGGGLFNGQYSWADVENSLFWGNHSDYAGTQIQNYGSMSVNYSGIEDGFSGAGNLTLSSSDDVFLASVRADGTNTPNSLGDYHLNSNSPVIDQGDNTTRPWDTFDIDGDSNTSELLPLDIDGDNRVIASEIDMGADEYFGACPASPFNVSVDQAHELIFYIACANVTPITDTIALSDSVILNFVHNVLEGNNGLPGISSSIIIEGNGQTIERSTAISNTFRIFHVQSTGNLTLNNVTLSNGSANGNGGAVNSYGELTVNNSSFQNNIASSRGGAIVVSDGTATISGSTFMNNSAGVNGGALHNKVPGTVTISNSTLSGNSSTGNGGAIVSAGEATISNSFITGNHAVNWGGGIVNSDGIMTINNSTVAGNYSAHLGGGTYIRGTSVTTINNSVVWGNEAVTDGHQLRVNAPMTVTASGIEGGIMSGVGPMPPTDGGGNIDFDSNANVFVNPLRANGSNTPNTLGDYHLSINSVVINQGDNSLIPVGITTDIDGNDRILNGVVDLGADERAFALPPVNTNLIYNPGFTLGVNKDAGWTGYGSIIKNVTNGVMNLRFPAVVDGWLRQFRAAYPLSQNLTMVSWVTVSNPDPVTKTFQFMIRDSDLSNTYLCTFTVPPLAPARQYWMRFKTLTNWEIIRVDIRPMNVGGNGLNFDDVNLRYRPWVTLPTNQDCIYPYVPPLPPVDTNLIYNPGFDIGVNGDAGWRYEGNIIGSVLNEVMNLQFTSTVDGWLRQFRAAYPLQAQLRMVAWVTVSNPDPMTKTFQFMLRDSDLSNTYLCNFTIPANETNRTFYMRFKTLTDWEIIRVDLRPNVVDANGLQFDNVNLRYRPWLTFTANQECIPPNFSDEAPTPPPDTELTLGK